MSDFFDTMDEYEQQESSGGGGIISEIDFAVGYKTFVSGMDQESTFFPFAPGNDKAKQKALGEAKAVLEESGSSSRAQLSVQFRVSKDSVKGREVTWQGDRFFVHPIWTDAYKQLVKPALKEAGVKKPGEYWGRLTFGEDPSGRTELDQAGEERIALVGYLVEIYDDEETAEAASAGDESANGRFTVPDGWTADTWAEMVPTILEELGDEPGPKDKASTAKDYDVKVKDINTLLEEV